MTTLSKEQADNILADLRTLVPDATRPATARDKQRQLLLCGVICTLNRVDIAAPPFWSMNVMAGRVDRLFLPAK